MGKFTHLRLCASTAAMAGFLVCGGGHALAQDADAESIADEIIVTAQGRSESLQEVPVAVSVVTGETLVKANIRNLENLSQRLPGIRVQTASAADLLNIHGVGSSLNAGFEQSVATFVGGVYRGRGCSSRAAMFDIERVEVLKGPQTTFFGNNAIAGGFNITTRKAGKEFAFNASAFYAAEADEYSANLRPVAGLELYTDVGYLDAKYSQYPGAPCTIFEGATRPAPCLQTLAGSVRAFSPKWSGSVGFNYTQDVLSDFVVKLNANLFFTSGFFVNASIDPYLYQPSLKTIDARISFGPGDERREVAVIGRNLTDKFTGSYRTPVAGAVGTTQFLGDPRRPVGIQLSLKY